MCPWNKSLCELDTKSRWKLATLVQWFLVTRVRFIFRGLGKLKDLKTAKMHWKIRHVNEPFNIFYKLGLSNIQKSLSRSRFKNWKLSIWAWLLLNTSDFFSTVKKIKIVWLQDKNSKTCFGAQSCAFDKDGIQLNRALASSLLY
jgi:hypothetical protein